MKKISTTKLKYKRFGIKLHWTVCSYKPDRETRLCENIFKPQECIDRNRILQMSFGRHFSKGNTFQVQATKQELDGYILLKNLKIYH